MRPDGASALGSVCLQSGSNSRCCSVCVGGGGGRGGYCFGSTAVAECYLGVTLNVQAEATLACMTRPACQAGT
jgi:hypothetical protein